MNTAVGFDTHEFVRSLESAGMPTGQAEAISAAMRKAHESGDMATKADVRRLDTKTEAAMTLLRKDIEMFEQRTTARFTLLQWMLGLLTAGTGTITSCSGDKSRPRPR